MNQALASEPSTPRADAPQRLVEDALRHAPGDGVHVTALAALSLVRAASPSQPLPAVYHPSLCVVLQGRKRALLGGTEFRYDPLHCLVVSMTVPVTGEILEATPARPYLCVRVALDPGTVRDLASQLPDAADTSRATPPALYVARVDDALLDAVQRLLRLLDAPQAEASVLAPLALREIHYRVLVGDLGGRLRALCDVDGHAHRIARAIDLLKARFAEPLRVEALAAAAHMSPSALHQRFKAATSLSPLQFQKRLRLQEARRLMLGEGIDAASAGHRVGYGSPSQFSRDYRRLFGAPPRRETAGRGIGA